jgi:hypothetical protein
MDLDRNRFHLSNASATIGKISLGGSASFPRFCTSDQPCESSFDLTTDDLNLEQWNEVLNPHLKKKPWYRLFGSSQQERNVIANLHASGQLSARRLTLDTTTGSAFATRFALNDGVLKLQNAHAELLGGTVSGDWKIDFSGNEPSYESNGQAERIEAEKLGTFFKSSFGTGTVALKYKLSMSGWDADALATSATAETEFTWNGGALRISPDLRAPLRVLNGNGKAALDKDGWTVSASKWMSPTGTYNLSGTISRNSELAFEFTKENGAVWKVSGTLAKPQPGSTPAPPPTQARRR